MNALFREHIGPSVDNVTDDELKDAFLKLTTDRQRQVASLYYGLLGETRVSTKEVAKIAGDISSGRIIQIRNVVLRKMRSLFEEAPKVQTHSSGIPVSVRHWDIRYVIMRRLEREYKVETVTDVLVLEHSKVRSKLTAMGFKELIEYLGKFGLSLTGPEPLTEPRKHQCPNCGHVFQSQKKLR